MRSTYKFLFVGFILFAACKNKAKNPPATGRTTDTLKKSAPAAPIVVLTDEQITGIGLQTGSIEYRNLKTTLKVNGKLTLPPQNQAQVSVLAGGIVKTIAVTEGEFVNQGRILATLGSSYQ